MAQTYPGFDSKEQHDDYVAALDNELAVLKARKNPRAKEVEAEIAKHRESKPRQTSRKPRQTKSAAAKADAEKDDAAEKDEG